MSDIPAFPYRDLWQERVLRSVANLTRADGDELLALAARVPVRTEVTTFALENANQALADLRHGRFRQGGGDRAVTPPVDEHGFSRTPRPGRRGRRPEPPAAG